MAKLLLKYKTHLLFFFFIYLLQLELFPQTAKLDFENFSIDQGLTTRLVSCILQDRMGFLWFCTWNGLYRYDGYNFVSYKHDPDDTSSINNSYVATIYEDRTGILWIGTWHGLEKFDRSTGRFINYTPDPSDSSSNLSNSVWAIHEDKYGMLWVGTGNGLNKFDRSTGKFTCLRYDSTDPGSINHNAIHSIYEDETGSLWFGTGGGLDKLDFKTGKFKHFWNDLSNRNKIWMNNSKYWISAIYGDNNGSIWLGTNGGLVEFNQKTGTFTNYLPNPNEKQVLSDNLVTSICQDESGILWLGTRHLLYAFDIKSKKFIGYDFYENSDPRSLTYNLIFSVYVEQSGTLWVGTERGANKIKLKKNPFKKYLSDLIVLRFIEDKGEILVGNYNKWIKFNPISEKIIPYSFGIDNLVLKEDSGDLWAIDLRGNLYKRDIRGNITYFYDFSGKRFNKDISYIHKTKKGFWIGTEQGGLYFLDPAKKHIREVYKSNLGITNIFEDSFGLVWASTFMGKLLCFNPKQAIVNEFISDLKVEGSISGRQITSIHDDKNGRLWFTTNVGLNEYNRLTKKFTHFTEKNGLLDNNTYAILEDNYGFLWVSTNKGFSKFDPEKEFFQNFYVSLGTPNAKAFKTANGEMYFPAEVGFIRFYPDSIKINPFIPPIEITSFKKFDKVFPIVKELHLDHNDNYLSFEFAALNYINTDKNQYAYKMEGLDKDWVYSGTRHFASYPNLDPGEYIFRVKGSNNDGVWNEAGTSITIIISPPFWETWWAYLSYAGLFIFALYGIRRYEMNRISYKNQVKVDKAILNEKEETEKIKSRFFANISHEFRTPLTLILGPAEKIISKTSDDIIKDANIIKRNSRRLLQLINQLLDLSKLESGKLKLEASKGNIVSFVKGVALSFESLAESKDITLSLLPEKDFIELYFDKEKMMKILTNLLSNAFKFTPEEGMVTVSINMKPSSFPPLSKGELKGGSVEIKIRDTGIGIPQKEIPKLFDRFYQVDSSFTKEHEGTGIGLALTKELIELHHGKINVESKFGNPDNPPKADGISLPTDQASWTEFTVTLPLGSSHLKDDEIIKIEKTDVSIIPIEQEVYTSSLSKTATDSIGAIINDGVIKDQLEEKTIILVVEDNYDMREYIKESLGNNYRVEEAVNGEQGVRKAEKIIPDLIISDMMMPRMDGSELTRILKSNEKTSHIPIILLTARSGQENKVEGLETGADDYLTKPFDIKELQARIENLISIRKKLQAKYSKIEYVLMPNGKKGTSIDEQFIIKIMEVIDKHISEEEFSIEDFGSEVGMSRTQFHRKIKAITGKPASMLLRSIRLARAKKMIEEQHRNISEVAYSVGFSTPSYFTKCFKEEFGYVPSDLND